MAAVTGTVTRAYPQNNVAMLLVTTPTTTDAGDTCAINLSTYGIAVFLGARGWVHTTTGSVVIASEPTTAVSGTTLTLTFPTGAGAGNTNCAHTVVIWGIPQTDTNITQP